MMYKMIQVKGYGTLLLNHLKTHAQKDSKYIFISVYYIFFNILSVQKDCFEYLNVAYQ